MLPERRPALAGELARGLLLPFAAAELLAGRGIKTVEEARAFLTPTVDQLHDPLTMRGMAEAVARVRLAIERGETVLIYGDYDVDGTTAVVLLKTAIERLGGAVRFHVPHRLREGYGMQREVLERAASEGVRLVVSVDTGIRAFAAAEAAEELGLDLIVTDHHLPDGALPRAVAVLNPNQAGCGYASKALCGAGVAFKLSQALLESSAETRDEREKLRAKVLPSFMKMLAIATVADAVPLTGENRAIVALGLAGLRDPVMSPGLRALLRVAQLDPSRKALSAMDVGFRLGPRINAAGRMDVASEVVELFTTRDAGRASLLAEKLDRLNVNRRETEAGALRSVLARIAGAEFAGARCLVVDGEGWHRGVIGILASRVVEAAGTPAVVIAVEDGEAHGSGRSVEGFHLLEALESCAELFTRFGGHAHAVGFSLPAARVAELRRRLVGYAARHVSDALLLPPVRCDGELGLEQVTAELYRAVRRMEPFGMDNPEPAFAAYGVSLEAEPRVMKERHCKLQLRQGAVCLAALGWGWASRVADMRLKAEDRVDLVYRLRENEHPEYGGLELEIVDLRRARGEAG